MINEIGIGKIYINSCGDAFRKPCDFNSGFVAYWYGNNLDDLKNSKTCNAMEVEQFKKICKEYKEPLTFARIRDERINKIKFNGVIYIPIGFSFDGDLICLMPVGGVCEWKEEEIKNWEIVK